MHMCMADSCVVCDVWPKNIHNSKEIRLQLKLIIIFIKEVKAWIHNIQTEILCNIESKSIFLASVI